MKEKNIYERRLLTPFGSQILHKPKKSLLKKEKEERKIRHRYKVERGVHGCTSYLKAIKSKTKAEWK